MTYPTVGSRNFGNPERTLALSTVGIDGWMGRRGHFDLTVAGTFQGTTFTPSIAFDAIQLGLVNTNPGKSPRVNSCSISNPSTVTDLNNSAGVWTQVTKKQLTVFDLACPVGNGTDQLEEITWTDITPMRPRLPVDGNFGLITFRVAMAAFSVASFGGLPVGGDGSVGQTGDVYTNWATRPDGRIRAWRFQTGSFAGAGSQAGFNTQVNMSQCPVVAIKYYFRGACVQTVTLGDSNKSNAGGTYRDENGLFIACSRANDLMAGEGPVFCHWPLGWSGSQANGYTGYMRRARNLLRRGDIGPIEFMHLAANTANDSAGVITAATLATSAAALAQTLGLGAQQGTKFLLDDWPAIDRGTRDWSTDSSAVASDTLRIAENIITASRASKNIFVAQIASKVLQTTPYNGQEQPVINTGDQSSFGYPVDGIHWPDILHAYEAGLFLPYMLQKVGVR